MAGNHRIPGNPLTPKDKPHKLYVELADGKVKYASSGIPLILLVRDGKELKKIRANDSDKECMDAIVEMYRDFDYDKRINEAMAQ